jgi:hypothetical protein
VHVADEGVFDRLVPVCQGIRPTPRFYIEKANQAGIAGTTPDGMLAAVLLRRGAEMSSSSHSRSQLFQPTPVR